MCLKVVLLEICIFQILDQIKLSREPFSKYLWEILQLVLIKLQHKLGQKNYKELYALPDEYKNKSIKK